MLVALQRLHDHAHRLHGAFQPAVHAVEAVHAARDVGQQPQALGLLLRSAGLLAGITGNPLVTFKTTQEDSQLSLDQ